MASKAIYPFIAVLGIAAVSGAAWWYQNKPPASRGNSEPSATSPAAVPAPQGSASTAAARPPVEVARVEVMKLVDDTQAVGTLRSRRGVVVRPEVSGRITQLNFRDGERVRKGQLLVQFDDQLQAAQVVQAQAELSIAQANFRRNQELAEQNFISRRAEDESAANLQVAQAKLSLARATAARLKILAPFDGIAGIRLVNVGDYLKDGADIVNIEDIEAIYVDYRLPERFQAKVQRGQSAVVDIDALPGRKFAATVQAIDPLIDANGRSVGVRGCMDNRLLQLRPGMFARVNTVFGQRDNARVIPEEAIVPQGGRQFVIKLLDGPDGQSRISQRIEVKVGLRSPGKVEILEGLDAGDTVVTTGQQRVTRDGTAVRVVDLAAPARPGASAASAAAGENGSAAGGKPSLPAENASANASNTAVRPPAAPAATAAASAPLVSAAVTVQTPAPGVNPCLVSIAGVSGSGSQQVGPAPQGRRQAAPETGPAAPRARDPA